MTLSTAWFPPVGFFALLAENPIVYIEACESYRKQTWRNRCRILTANGPMDLRVPVAHDGERLITRIRTNWSTPWLRQNCYAIDSAYYSSPFFEYYRDELFAVLERRQEFLWDMNMDHVADVQDDWRDALSPKRPSPIKVRPYWQVFRERYGFVDGLSVMDLLFNEGPESLSQLRRPLTELSR